MTSNISSAESGRIERNISWVWNGFLLLFILIALVEVLARKQSAPSIHESPVETLRMSYGQVIAVDMCERGSSSLKCRVITDRNGHHYRYMLDILEMPGSRLHVGDEIGLQHTRYQRVLKTGLYKNDDVVFDNTCWSWHPCWIWD